MADHPYQPAEFYRQRAKRLQKYLPPDLSKEDRRAIQVQVNHMLKLAELVETKEQQAERAAPLTDLLKEILDDRMIAHHSKRLRSLLFRLKFLPEGSPEYQELYIAAYLATRLVHRLRDKREALKRP